MCGIALIRKLRGGRRVDPEDLRRMVGAIRHRGPDEAGYTLLDGDALGMAHVRLSIIDLASGQQPLFNPDTGSAIVFNGELYDYADHRRELEQRGHRFQTSSDTEVLLRLYDEYGLACLDKLRGEFAFVIWDARKRRLVAARDALGVKPLFYHHNGEEILFASEVKGLFALSRVQRAIAPAYLVGPVMGVCPANSCAFSGVSSLSPGHFLVVDEAGVGAEQSYWTQPFSELDGKLSFADACAGVREQLTRAVKRRLIADVPVHVYLSSGIDSTLMLALATKLGARPTAYHISFPDSAYDEAARARAIAESMGASFDVTECRFADMAEHLVETVEHIEGTIANLNSAAKLMLSAHVRKRGTKVCLTGEGSDECFAGYAFFRLESIWRMLEAGSIDEAKAESLLARLAQTSGTAEGIQWDRSQRWRTAARPYGYACHIQARMDALGTSPLWLLNPELGLGSAQAPGAMFRQTFPPAELGRMPPLNATRVYAFASLSGYLIPALGDRVEMANSLECRTPFLDRDLVDFACRLPAEHLVDFETMREKHVLRTAFSELLPEVVKQGAKQSFLAPQWRELEHTKIGKQLLADHLSHAAIKQAGLFRPSAVSTLRLLSKTLPAHTLLARTVDLAMGTLLSTQILHDRMIKQPWSVPSDFALELRAPRGPQNER